MKPLRVLILVSATLLGGCYSVPRWAQGPPASEQRLKRDDYECVRETSQRGAGGTGLAGAAVIMSSNKESKRLYTMCMELRGWTQVEEGGVKGGWRPL
jgi:hypothetical protein